jgi:hypothetical protein
VYVVVADVHVHHQFDAILVQYHNHHNNDQLEDLMTILLLLYNLLLHLQIANLHFGDHHLGQSIIIIIIIIIITELNCVHLSPMNQIKEQKEEEEE